MFFEKLAKFACCRIDLTIACRAIAFAGVAVSVLLITVLMNDKYIHKNTNYDMSRKTALALGLDWQHFHSQASTAYVDDPDGRMISIIVVFYAVVFLIINFLLFFATVKRDWRCTIPWLVCELFGCLSKFGALIYHFHVDSENLSAIFVIGSAVYIAIVLWWWVVVFSAQMSWRCKDKSTLSLEMSVISTRVSRGSKPLEESIPGKIRFAKEEETLDSPLPYFPNSMYALI